MVRSGQWACFLLAIGSLKLPRHVHLCRRRAHLLYHMIGLNCGSDHGSDHGSDLSASVHPPSARDPAHPASPSEGFQGTTPGRSKADEISADSRDAVLGTYGAGAEQYLHVRGVAGYCKDKSGKDAASTVGFRLVLRENSTSLHTFDTFRSLTLSLELPGHKGGAGGRGWSGSSGLGKCSEELPCDPIQDFRLHFRRYSAHR